MTSERLLNVLYLPKTNFWLRPWPVFNTETVPLPLGPSHGDCGPGGAGGAGCSSIGPVSPVAPGSPGGPGGPTVITQHDL